ncbi:hypothetical protein M422DRAFT_262388 [Sphaerobolus stellatus SS14]|uniref:Uncharacterized protein n=1 Tax=Sphaerobolus stellatus (strain SS14) TaxID=990650 RepID=A0A0C9UKR2_SPHS4|nr:hypothetical protein M422DRAFT_262388 [Sphaerobolus stellatus SS14]
MLQECILHISDSLPINFLLSLPISTERPFVRIYRELDDSSLKFNHSPFDYIPYLTGLQNLTCVGGFNWDPSFIAEEKKVFLAKFSTKLEYIGSRGQHSPVMWIPLQISKDEGSAPEKKILRVSHVFPWAV